MPKNKLIKTEKNITTLEIFVDPKLENRVADNGLDTIISNDYNNNNGDGDENIIVAPIYVEDDSVSQRLYKTSSANSLRHESISLSTFVENTDNNNNNNSSLLYKTTSSGSLNSQSTDLQTYNEGKEEEEDEHTSTNTSIREELLSRIVSKDTEKYDYYSKITKDFFGKDIADQKTFRLLAFWRALSYGVTLSFEDAFAIIYHMNDIEIAHKLSKELGVALGLNYLNLNLAQKLIDCIKATPAYKIEIEEKTTTEFGRSSAGLTGLVGFLNTFSFSDPKALANINSFIKFLFLDPALKHIKDFLKKNKLMVKPKNAQDCQALNEKLERACKFDHQKFSNNEDKSVKNLIEALYKIIEGYFDGPMQFACKHPGAIAGEMKAIVRGQLSSILNNFLNERKSRMVQIEGMDTYYFIAQAENATKQSLEYVLMRIQNITTENEKPTFVLTKVSSNNPLFSELPIDHINTIENIIMQDEVYYFIFRKKEDYAKQNNIPQPEFFHTKLMLVNDEPKLIAISEVEFKKIFPEDHSPKNYNRYIHSSYEYKGKILPDKVFTLLTDFIAHHALGMLLHDLAELFKDAILKEWKINRQKAPDYIIEYTNALGQQAEVILYAVFVSPVMNLACFLSDDCTKLYPHSQDEQLEIVQAKHNINSIGNNYLKWYIANNLLIGHPENHDKYFGSALAFLDDQDKSNVLVKQEAVTPPKEPDLKDLAEAHYELLCMLKPTKLPKDENFFRVALADMMRNGYPVDIVIQDIKAKNYDLEKIFLFPDKILRYAHNDQPLNLMQIAYIEQNKSFFKHFHKGKSLTKKVLPIAKDTILKQLDSFVALSKSQEKFYSEWFPGHIGKVSPTPPSSPRTLGLLASTRRINDNIERSPESSSNEHKCTIM